MLRMLVIGYATEASFGELACAIMAAGMYESVEGIPIGEDVSDLAQDWLDRNSGQKIALTKGNAIETADFLRIIIGRRKSRPEDDLGVGKLTHCFIFHSPDGGKFMMTDCAIAISPDQNEKLYAAECAMQLWEDLFVAPHRQQAADSPAGGEFGACPRRLNISIISATGKLNPKVKSSVDGMFLIEKLSDRAEIRLDQMDTALFPDAAAKKGMINKPRADILIAPDLDSGNGYYKLLSHLGYPAAGLVLGAKIPICLNSRSDSLEEKVMAARYAAELSRKNK